MDIFKYQKERLKEQKLKKDYLLLLECLSNPELSAVEKQEIIQWPQYFKGFGHVKFKQEKQAYLKMDLLISKNLKI